MVRTNDAIPERIDGWQGLSDYLATLGLRHSAAALCQRARRKDLSYHGGQWPGSGVWFTADDLQAWTADLTGVDLDLWILQAERNRERAASRTAAPERLGPRRPGPWKQLVAQRQHYVLLRAAAWGETLLRTQAGRGFVATSQEETDTWRQRAIEAADAFVLFRSFRNAGEADFLPRELGPRPAVFLLVAFRMWNSRLKPVEVPGTLLGLPGVETSLPVVISPNDPHLPALRRVVQEEYPSAMWFVWHDRVDLDPVTLEQVTATDRRGRR